MLQLQYPYTYVASVYCKCFIYFRRMLQLFYQQAQLGGAGRGGPLGRSGPRVRAGSQADAENKAVSMSVAASVEHEAASMLIPLSPSLF
jgi:hypothetical protein